jgi:hypothetical protein
MLRVVFPRNIIGAKFEDKDPLIPHFRIKAKPGKAPLDRVTADPIIKYLIIVTRRVDILLQPGRKPIFPAFDAKAADQTIAVCDNFGLIIDRRSRRNRASGTVISLTIPATAAHYS